MADTPSWVTEVLWPDSVTGGSWFRPAGNHLVANPSAVSPRQLLPWTIAAAIGAGSRATDDRTRTRSLQDGLGALALLGLAPFQGRRQVVLQSASESLVDHLRSQIDGTIRSAVVMAGPVRANQKPVLQLLDRWGRTRAFAKVGWNPLTRSLLQAEHDALHHLAGVESLDLTVPRVLGRGDFGQGSWLAISPASVERRRPPSADVTMRTARAIEGSAEPTTQPFTDSAFVRDLVRRSADLATAGPAIARLSEQHGDRPVAFGAAHGDFVPWNILSGLPRPAVWDWERYTTSAPLGFDRLHHALQVEFHRRKRSTPDAVGAVASQLGELLPELGAADAEISFVCYLAELMCRYEHDAAESGIDILATRATEIAIILRERGTPR